MTTVYTNLLKDKEQGMSQVEKRYYAYESTRRVLFSLEELANFAEEAGDAYLYSILIEKAEELERRAYSKWRTALAKEEAAA